ncbi:MULTISPECIES: trypco2 family protein [unclassified Streptomyces]|uniref:trypco2 family protein n=1 Tax=unclassified Streptomyces TaxID=2593676 RepID=UPI00371B476C
MAQGGNLIELADVIRELRQQLTTALLEGQGEALRFELGPVDVEATVAVSREAGADGTVRPVLIAGGEVDGEC